MSLIINLELLNSISLIREKLNDLLKEEGEKGLTKDKFALVRKLNCILNLKIPGWQPYDIPLDSVFRVWKFESDDGNGDRWEIGRLITDSPMFYEDFDKKVIEEFFKPECRDDVNSDGDGADFLVYDTNFAYDEDGEIIDDPDDDAYYRTEGIQLEIIEEPTEEDREFNLIVGGSNVIHIGRE